MGIDEYVYEYFKRQADFKDTEDKHKKLQAAFNAKMDEYFDSLSTNKRKNAVFRFNGNAVKVTRVAPTKVKWLPDKLRSRLTKPVWRQVAKKHYEISDIDGLVCYLKSCNVDPKIFKSFIEVTEVVDPKAIERLSELGGLTAADIRGCYLVECSKPYYKLKGIIDER